MRTVPRLFFLGLLLIPMICFAQVNLSDSALIPKDSTVRIGHLQNGLTYYIKYNNWRGKYTGRG